jgi:hypothetical protein
MMEFPHQFLNGKPKVITEDAILLIQKAIAEGLIKPKEPLLKRRGRRSKYWAEVKKEEEEKDTYNYKFRCKWCGKATAKNYGICGRCGKQKCKL